MAKVLVIPDVHLKPWIFAGASELAAAISCDVIVMLGDLVDDWDQERNVDLYRDTFAAAMAFVKEHPNTFWCYGNHDVSYLWEAMESGYSYYAREAVLKGLSELKDVLPPGHCAFIHRIDNVLFSHAGLAESFVERNFGTNVPELDDMIKRINSMGRKELWQEDSQLWARPQFCRMIMYPRDMIQVVGHTPVKAPLSSK